MFVQKNFGGKGGEDKAEAGQWPEKTDVAFGHQHEQSGKKHRLKENSKPDLRAGDAGLDHAENFGGRVGIYIADLHDAFFQQYHPGRFAKQADKQDQQQFEHIPNLGGEDPGCQARKLALQPLRARVIGLGGASGLPQPGTQDQHQFMRFA